ncbi:hypothetical protein SDC9_130511 [bioreactor metagenome]|uniref:Uncharacterized protein n=1 Tax=bioreactor metagenome TaxID=1076179 RepID=A0A645D2Q4_9ZZZZ
MKGLLCFAQGRPLGFDLQPVRSVAIGFRVRVRQTAGNGGGKAHLGHAENRALAPAHGLPQLLLGKGKAEFHALAHFGEVVGPTGGIFRRVGRQQQQPHVPCPGRGLHRLLAHLQQPGPLAQAQRRQ